MAAPDFWSNRERAQGDVEEVSRLRSLINPFQQLEREIEDFSALQELAAEESDPAHRAQAEKEGRPMTYLTRVFIKAGLDDRNRGGGIRTNG